jgi:TolA-binding protein
MTKSLRHLFKKSAVILFLICESAQISLTFADGYPGEYLATQKWRYLFSSTGALTNPAFINEENYINAKYALSSNLMGSFLMHEAEFVVPIGLYQAAAVSWLMQGAKPYEKTDENYQVLPGTAHDQQNMFMLTYANNLWAGLTLGANLDIFANNQFNKMYLGFGLDAGLSYRLLRNPVIGDHLLGISIQNLINPIMIVGKTQDQYPRILRLSLNSKFWENQIETGVDFGFKDIGVPSKEFDSLGVTNEWDLNAKLGCWILRIAKLYGLAGFTKEGFDFWGFALGFNMPSINNGRDFSFLYQYLTNVNTDFASHTFYIRSDFGKHREEIYARKMAKMANVAPNDLYIKATELYSQGKYWDAFFIFSELYIEYPDFFKSDWVSFFLGSCQENMYMNTTAEDAFKVTKEKFGRSTAAPFADLGLMRVYYRENNTSGVEQQFNELNKLGVPDSIKYHGYYIMGESQMKQGNQQKAKQLFDLIPDTHPDYVFAQHSAAIAEAMADNIEAAVSHLENCVQFQAKTDAQREVINRSFLFLGFIFYESLTKEEGTLSKAVTALRMIPKTSFYYPEALLGLGWTGLKARQWSDCSAAGQELSGVAPNAILKAEGELLQAYSNMMQKNYPVAANLLQTASSELSNFQKPSQEEFSSKQQDYEQVRSQYTDLAKKAYELGTTRQSSLVLKEIDSLHTFQTDFMSKIKSHYKYVDQFERLSFFTRNLESVQEDVDYALAKAQKLAGQSQTNKVNQKADKEQQKIDEELKKLQDQLKQQQGQ